MKETYLNIRLEEDLKLEIKQICKVHRTTPSEFTRYCLESVLEAIKGEKSNV